MRILFLSPWFPVPAYNGSKIRIFHLLKTLTAEHDITLLSFVRDGEIVDIDRAVSLFGNVKTVPWIEFRPNSVNSLLAYLDSRPRSLVTTYSRKMKNLVGEQIRLWEPDIIVASQIGTAVYALNKKAPKLLEEFEVGYLKNVSNQRSIIIKLRSQLTWLKSQAYWRKKLPQFDACTVVSDDERMMVQHILTDSKMIQVIPNGIDTHELQFGMGEAQPGRLIYPGAVTYNLNYDAVKYFLDDIFPIVRVAVPTAELWVTGSIQGVDLSGFSGKEGTKFTGHLDDIHAAVASSWVCVVPLRHGGGTRLKILEAMAIGTPVVSTSKGAEGLEISHEVNILIADTPQEFAQQVLRLMNETELRQRLITNARRLVESKYDWVNIGKKFLQLVEKVALRA